MATATLADRTLDVPEDSEVVFGQIYEVGPKSAYAVFISNLVTAKLVIYAHAVPDIGRPLHEMPFRLRFPVEVVSPTDSYEDVIEKAGEYLRAGARLVWVVGPRSRTVQIFAPAAAPRTLSAPDTLDGGDVLPGFAVRVGDLFPPVTDLPVGVSDTPLK